ncbi:MAG TPA: PIG-L deacetylase family protein [Acidimicrobiales bacterium]|nr:PIG-L deacetylase family protein [Acidimicrobiales bacterium]
MTELLRIEPTRVLAVYAHPDDLEISCGGALVRWAAAGASTHVLTCTQGDKGSVDPATDPATLAAQRSAEAAAAAAIMGVSTTESLGYADGDIENSAEVRGRLVACIRTLQPDIVICPDPTAVFFGDRYINHHDHRVVGWAVLDACAPAAASPLYYPETGPPHQVQMLLLSGTLAPDVWIDITAAVDRKIAALLCHASQVGTDERIITDIVRGRAAEAGVAAGIRHAESFRRVRLVG